MQINERISDTGLASGSENDPLVEQAKQQLGNQSELEVWFPPSCEKGGTQE